MKKTAIVIAITLTGLTSIAQATPNNNTWYAGGKLGWSRFYDTSWHDSVLNNDGPTHKHQVGVDAFGGYQANKHVGLEMGYEWLGYVPYKGNTINGSYKAQGVQLTTKLGYTVMDNIDLYTRLGGIVWHARSNNKVLGNNFDTGISPVFASGTEWKVSDNISARLEYQWINSIGDNKTTVVHPNNGMLNLGIHYHFGQQKNIPTIPSEPISVSKTLTKRSILKSNILFDFNDSNLKFEGQQILDNLYTQLTNSNFKNSSVIILGYTDHIGSNAYNQSLSEKRTQSTVDYLISKGIPNDKIVAHSMGESNPITGNKCNKIKNRAQLIECLSPDRRVEIEIKDPKDAITTQHIES